MAVEGVNNSSNSGYYALGAAALGAGAGAGAAYLTKPFLKDGAPTDEFIKKIEEKMVNSLNPNDKQMYEEGKQQLEAINKLKNAEELKEFIKNNKALQETGMVDIMLEAVEKDGFEKSIKNLKDGVNMGLEIKDGLYKDMFESAWDANAKKFVNNAENLTKEGFEAVKGAAKSIQGKYAMIYGAISAAVLGLGTLLFAGGKSDDAKVIDTQA